MTAEPVAGPDASYPVAFGMKARLGRRGALFASVAAGYGVASVAGYVLLAVVGRTLTPGQFGLFVVFWGILFALGGSLTTTEQEAARRTASGDEAATPALGTVALASAMLAGLAAALTLVPPIADRLYGDVSRVVGVLVVLAVISWAVQFAVRGALIGSGHVRGFAGLTVAEAVLRIVLLLLVLATFGLNLVTAAIAVIGGSFAWLIWFGRGRAILRLVDRNWRAWWGGLRRSLSLMVGAALTAAVITGYPTLVTALTGQVPGEIFAILTITRAPLLLLSPVQAVAVPAVVRWRAQAQVRGLSRIRGGLVGGTVAAAILSGLGGVVGWLSGPWVLQLVYGHAYHVERVDAALLAASTLLLGWLSLVSAALIALSAYRFMILVWLSATIVTALWLAISPLGVADTTAMGALIGPLAGMAVGLPGLWTRAGRAPAPATVAPAPVPV
jgi:O-antigen/teichoic acid export membrane protein